MNPLVTRIGRRLGPEIGMAAQAGGRISRKAAIGAGLATVGILGASRGFNSTSGDLNDAFYELTTGNPNIDQDVFGQDMSAQNLLWPAPNFPGPDFERIRRTISLATNPSMLGRSQLDLTNKNRLQNRMPYISGSTVFDRYRTRGG